MFSLGVLTLMWTFCGVDVDININRDEKGEKLAAVCTKLKDAGFSAGMINVIEAMLTYSEETRPDFVELESLIK